MTINQLASALAKAEGKKVSVSVGNVRELIKILRKLIKQNPEILLLLSK